MTATATRIETANGRRYLTQLCKHWAHKFAVTQEDDRGVVPFGPDRRCRMAADDTGLDLVIEVEDPAGMTRLQEVVIDHLKRFAFREELGEPVWTLAA